MAAPESIQALLSSLSQSLSSALEATPKLSSITPPEEGISLLNLKSELLLSYLQNVVFLVLVKIRNAKNGISNDNPAEENPLDESVVKKLVELRLYLEKGVRPMEEKLQYQIETALRVVADGERSAQAGAARLQSSKTIRRTDDDSAESEASQSEAEDDDDGDDADDASAEGATEKILSGPNKSAFARRSTSASATASKDKTGVYRPPRNKPTVMPTTERKERRQRGPLKSATMDEYIEDEMSVAPVAQPSIGTNIRARGQLKTATERREEAERQAYEEANFIRLPKKSKKDRLKKAQSEGRGGRMNFGGEEWRGLNEGVDRINRLTKGKSSGGVRALLEKSRKRGYETTDGPRGSGSGAVEIGERYQKRLKTQERGKKRR